jgi:hypothetical protein
MARFDIHLTTTNKFFLGCTPTSGASTASKAVSIRKEEDHTVRVSGPRPRSSSAGCQHRHVWLSTQCASPTSHCSEIAARTSSVRRPRVGGVTSDCFPLAQHRMSVCPVARTAPLLLGRDGPAWQDVWLGSHKRRPIFVTYERVNIY